LFCGQRKVKFNTHSPHAGVQRTLYSFFPSIVSVKSLSSLAVLLTRGIDIAGICDERELICRGLRPAVLRLRSYGSSLQ